MNKEHLLSKVQSVIQGVFDNQNLIITIETTAKDVEGWDSLNHLTIITTIEEFFNIRFSTREVMSFANVGDFVNCIFNKLNTK